MSVRASGGDVRSGSYVAGARCRYRRNVAQEGVAPRLRAARVGATRARTWYNAATAQQQLLLLLHPGARTVAAVATAPHHITSHHIPGRAPLRRWRRHRRARALRPRARPLQPLHPPHHQHVWRAGSAGEPARHAKTQAARALCPPHCTHRECAQSPQRAPRPNAAAATRHRREIQIQIQTQNILVTQVKPATSC